MALVRPPHRPAQAATECQRHKLRHAKVHVHHPSVGGGVLLAGCRRPLVKVLVTLVWSGVAVPCKGSKTRVKLPVTLLSAYGVLVPWKRISGYKSFSIFSLPLSFRLQPPSPIICTFRNLLSSHPTAFCLSPLPPLPLSSVSLSLLYFSLPASLLSPPVSFPFPPLPTCHSPLPSSPHLSFSPPLLRTLPQLREILAAPGILFIHLPEAPAKNSKYYFIRSFYSLYQLNPGSFACLSTT